MLKPTLILSLILGVSVTTNPAAQGGRPSATPSSNEPALTALDYIEIEQLSYRYGWALDSGENNGYAYADLYAPDGTFTGTNQGPSGRTYQGRDNLAALARGGRRGPLYVSHLVTNVVITPTPEGAVGRAYVGIFDLGEAGKAPAAGHGGFYDDVYVKTSNGWRIKKRSYYESRWGEPNVEIPPPIPTLRALKEAKAAPAPAAKGPSLTAQDYVELQQLVANYPYALDVNSDNGQSYANLFTPDGTFGCVLPDAGPGVPERCVTSSGQLAPQARPRAKGHEALAKMVNTEEPHGPNYVRHFIFNHVIEPTAAGAKGKEYAAVIDIVPGQQGQQAHSIYLVGRYDDEYVKTPQGWRFKTRAFTAAARREPPAAKK
jgi:SnoaL-like domain